MMRLFCRALFTFPTWGQGRVGGDSMGVQLYRMRRGEIKEGTGYILGLSVQYVR
jgi:hypothetical protein